ncbi:9060_t:CDS:1, partial [Cetraspora pellucida]
GHFLVGLIISSTVENARSCEILVDCKEKKSATKSAKVGYW